MVTINHYFLTVLMGADHQTELGFQIRGDLEIGGGLPGRTSRRFTARRLNWCCASQSLEALPLDLGPLGARDLSIYGLSNFDNSDYCLD